MIGAVDVKETQLLSILKLPSQVTLHSIFCSFSEISLRKRGAHLNGCYASAKDIEWRHDSLFLYTKFWAPINGLIDLVTSGIWNQIHMAKNDLGTSE